MESLYTAYPEAPYNEIYICEKSARHIPATYMAGRLEREQRYDRFRLVGPELKKGIYPVVIQTKEGKKKGMLTYWFTRHNTACGLLTLLSDREGCLDSLRQYNSGEACI